MKTKASQALKKMERLIDLVTMALSIVMMFLLIALFSFAGLYMKSLNYAFASGVIILMLAMYIVGMVKNSAKARKNRG